VRLAARKLGYPPGERVSGAVLHSESARRQRFFEERFDLGAQAGFSVREQAEPFDRAAADDVRRIEIERHEQSGGPKAVRPRPGDACDDQSQMGARSPVVVRAFAEEAEDAVGVRRKQLGVPLCDAASGIRSTMAQDGVVREERAQERLKQAGASEHLRSSATRVGKTPPGRIESQLDF